MAAFDDMYEKVQVRCHRSMSPACRVMYDVSQVLLLRDAHATVGLLELLAGLAGTWTSSPTYPANRRARPCLQSADAQSQKQKLEEDLKKEIKKLQRYRDQIKTWAASADVKNKQPLLDGRANIERRMEIFKIVERETKTKAYSKEGLMRDAALSAEERKRLKTREWVQDLVSKLGDEIDEMENELELISTGGGKDKKKDKETTTILEVAIRNHREHADKLEAVTRLVDLGVADPDEVDGIKEDLEYYLGV